MRNVLRISATSVVSQIILLVGKLLIVVLSTVGAYLYLEYYYEDQLRGLHIVTAIVFLISLMAAEMFNQIFAISISTILQCFVTDEETFEVIFASYTTVEKVCHTLLTFYYFMLLKKTAN